MNYFLSLNYKFSLKNDILKYLIVRNEESFMVMMVWKLILMTLMMINNKSESNKK